MSNDFTPEKIEKLADLLLIGVTEEEKKMVSDEFNQIDANINKLSLIPDLDKVEPMTHCLDDFAYVLREDVAEESISISDALSNSKNVDDREVSLPKVVG